MPARSAKNCRGSGVALLGVQPGLLYRSACRGAADELRDCSQSRILPSWNGLFVPRSWFAIRLDRRKCASELQIFRAAYRNRTDDLRITRRTRGVHGCPGSHNRPARAASRSGHVQADPGPLLADALALLISCQGVLAAPRRVSPPGPHARRVRGRKPMVLQTATAEVGLWPVACGDACGKDRWRRCIPRMSHAAGHDREVRSPPPQRLKDGPALEGRRALARSGPGRADATRSRRTGRASAPVEQATRPG